MDVLQVIDGEGEGELLAAGARDIRLVLDQDFQYMNDVTSDSVKEKITPHVSIRCTGKKIYKSTMISSLNEDKKLPADRLLRV